MVESLVRRKSGTNGTTIVVGRTLETEKIDRRDRGEKEVTKVAKSLISNFLHGEEGTVVAGQLGLNLGLFYINHAILLAIFFLISIYKNVEFIYHRVMLKFLTLAYYPNKTPQLIREDVTKLNKIPRRISCILDLKYEDDENGGIDGLVNDISELAAWSLSAGIPSLSVYEYSGAATDHLQQLCRSISKTLSVYFGSDLMPLYCVRVPHTNTLIYNINSENPTSQSPPEKVDLEIILLSRVDGKPTIVELTKTMSELVNKELSVNDITVDLIDEELVELVGKEPDLLVSFGPCLDLQDYPPWHIRLSEIYWEQDNLDVNYAVFIRALQRYSNCKINVGK